MVSAVVRNYYHCIKRCSQVVYKPQDALCRVFVWGMALPQRQTAAPVIWGRCDMVCVSKPAAVVCCAVDFEEYGPSAVEVKCSLDVIALPHLFRHVTVNIQSKGGCCVAQVLNGYPNNLFSLMRYCDCQVVCGIIHDFFTISKKVQPNLPDYVKGQIHRIWPLNCLIYLTLLQGVVPFCSRKFSTP